MLIEKNNQKQYGENGHQEYQWSNHIRENILQFYFQLTRTSNEITLRKLESRLIHLLSTLTEQNHTSEKDTIIAYLSYLYCLIGQTRDIIEGKGEYMLTYMMIYVWYHYYPDLAFFALEKLVQPIENEHPYGCWKDMKYFYKYCRDKGCNDDHPLIEKIIEITNRQLRQDQQTFTNPYSINPNISLASKWIPREKSKKWENLYTLLASDYFKETGKKSSEKAILKCKIEYRKMISTLNKYLDTTQVKQCDREWREIDFNKVTSITLSKNKKAFLNVKKNGDTRREEDDRIICANHFTNYIGESIKNNTDIKGKRIGMNDFTKEALELINERNQNIPVSEQLQTQMDLLNMQWKNNSSQTTTLKKMIAMVDVSGSMEGEPLYAAIALGIRIAEKSMVGNRIMTFSANPTWVNLESSKTFLDKVETIKEAEWGLNTNFYKALDKILDAIIETKLHPEEVKDMTLVILSDMQIDQGDDSNMKISNENPNWSLYSNIREKYEATGIRLYGKPFQPPHLLFWNLRSTDGFPNVSNEANTSMVSGFSPSLLNSFCENGMSSLQSMTPWSLFIKTMDNPRYRVLKTQIYKIVI
jgi:hypothetical protein